MEADCEMEDAEDEGLITSWVQENNAIVTRWKSLEALGDAQGVKLECYSDLSNLLQTIQGLPPTMQNLNLELTALCNTVILHINITGGFIPKHQEQFSNALNRVLECRGQQEASEKSSMELWEKVLARVPPAEIPPPLIRLAGLQSALWLAENRLEHIGNLLHVLQAHVMADQKHDLLQLVKMWEVPQEAEEGVLSLESACHVKDILYTTIAFQQGLHAMDAGKFHQAVTLLQEAASGLCTNKVLSELYTCLGYCFYKMGKPQTALQFWKKALSVDFHCLPALYHTSRLYSDTGRTEPELEVLRLLHMALTSQDPVSPESLFLFRTELILKTPILDRFVHVPTSLEVKYLIANRCLRNNSTQQAAEHYLDLMAALLHGSPPKSLYPSPAALPRVPHIYLEAAASLLQMKRFEDSLTICEEVLGTLAHVTEGITSIVDAQTSQKTESSREQLNCVLWASSAHYLQGEAHGKLGNHKDSISEYSRCVNLLMKVQFVDCGSDCEKTTEQIVFTFLKASAFLGRSHQFMKMENLKGALMNVRLALQVMPGFPDALLYLIGLLWKSGDKDQAGLELRRYQSNKDCLTEQYEAMRRNQPLILTVSSQKDFLLDKLLIQEVEDYLQRCSNDNGAE